MSEAIPLAPEPPPSAEDEGSPAAADPKQTRLLRELKHDRAILGCRFAGDGRFVFAGAQDYLVHRWDLQSAAEETPKISLEGHASWVRAMARFADGKRLATGDYVGRVILWQDIDASPVAARSWEAHRGSVRAVAVSPDGQLLATAGNDHLVRVWSVDGGDLALELAGHACHVYNVAFHPGGGALVSADLKGAVKHWEIPSGKLVRQLDASPLWMYSEKYTVDVGGVRGIAFRGDGSQLACTGATGEKGVAHSGNARVLLFDWASGNMLNALQPEKDEIATAWGVRFHPDGFVVGCGGSRTGGFVWYWQAEQPVAFHMFRFQQSGPGFDIDLASDGQTFAVAHFDGAVRVYTMAPEAKAETPAGGS